MDAAIADTINCRDARLVAEKLDSDDDLGASPRWFDSRLATPFTGEEDLSQTDRAWLFGAVASQTPGIAFDGNPADCDWDNLFSHFRAEILARRDPESHPVCAAESPCEVV